MKILIANTYYNPSIVGGAEIWTQMHAQALVAMGHHITVACLSPDNHRRSDNINGVHVEYMPISNVYYPLASRHKGILSKALWHLIDSYNPWMANKFSKLLDSVRPDIVHTGNISGFSASIWAASKIYKIPIVHTLHDYYLICPRTTMFRSGRNCTKKCTNCRAFSYPRKMLSNNLNLVVGVSKFILDRHLAMGYFDQVQDKRVIGNAYLASPDLTGLLVHPPEKIRLGYIGRIAPSKGIEFFLSAVANIRSASIEIWIAGDAPDNYFRHLQNAYREMNVHWMGFVPPPKLFGEIDVLVVPSIWHEPQGRVTIESYSHGIPVIASRRGGIPEIVDEGKTGFLFEPDDPGSLEEAISRFIDDPFLATRMRAATLEKAKTFNPSSVSAQYIDSYESVI